MAENLPTMKTAPYTKITVLISGSGSNLQAIIDAISSGLLPTAKIIRVISNKKSAFGLQRAEKANIPTRYFNLISGGYLKSGETDPKVREQGRERYDADLVKVILEDKPDLIVCAGWMHILSPGFLNPLAEAGIPIINLHPALPGKYDGAGAIKRAWEDFQNGKLENGRTGAMIHYVISEVDRGQPILVREIECREGESLEDLENRIHGVEHEIIVEGTGLAIAELAEKRKAAGEARS